MVSNETKPTTDFQAILENALLPLTSKMSESEEQTSSLLDELYSAITDALSPELEFSDRPLDRDLFIKMKDIINHVETELQLLPTEESADESEWMDELLYIFQQLNVIDLHEQQRLPVQKIAELVKMTKQVLPFEHHETAKLEQLNSELQKFVQTLKHAQLETRSSPFSDLLATVFMNRKDSIQPFIRPNHTIGNELHATIQQPMTKIEQFVLHLGNRTNEQSLMNEFVQQFSNMIAQSHLSQTRTSSRLFIKLYPEHLGTLKVELIQKMGR
ncbi:hypothetical protein ACI2OX_13130 [Bacillus sp. N9]